MIINKSDLILFLQLYMANFLKTETISCKIVDIEATNNELKKNLGIEIEYPLLHLYT